MKFFTLLNFYYFFIIIVGFYYIIYGLSLFINTKKILKLKIFNWAKSESGYYNDSINFIILIPVLREQKIIKETFDFLLSLEYDFSKLKIVIITTEREFLDKKTLKQQPSTPEIVKQLIPTLNKNLNKELFFNIHYLYRRGVKSDQLNYALNKLLKENPKIFESKNFYIGLYDADSKTDKSILKFLADDAIKNNFPIVYQQPTIYLKNYDLLPNNINGLFMKSFALWQTRYSLGYEIPMFLNSAINTRRRLAKMEYCIGHGLFIRADFLKKIGFFPTPIEDTRFGHILSYLKEEITLLPVFEITEVTHKISRLIKQTSVWFTGESFIINDWKIANKIRGVEKIRSLSLILHKLFRNFIWAIEGPIFIIIIFAGILLPNKIPLLVFVVGICIYFYLAAFYLLFVHKRLEKQTNKLINFHPTKKDFLFNICFLPLNGFLLFLGPQLAILRFIKSIFTKSIILPKTER